MISFDNSKDGGNATNTTITISYTNNGNMLFVGIRGSAAGSDNVSQVAYNSVLMTKVATSQKDTRWDSFWYLANPATGTNNVVITNGSSDYCETTIVSYFGSNGTIEGATSGTGTGNTTGTVTTTKLNDWVIMFGGATSTISGGAGTTLRQANGSNDSGILDSNGIAPIGSNSLIMNVASGNTAFLITGLEASPSGGFFAAAR